MQLLKQEALPFGSTVITAIQSMAASLIFNN